MTYSANRIGLGKAMAEAQRLKQAPKLARKILYLTMFLFSSTYLGNARSQRSWRNSRKGHDCPLKELDRKEARNQRPDKKRGAAWRTNESERRTRLFKQLCQNMCFYLKMLNSSLILSCKIYGPTSQREPINYLTS